MRRALPLVLVVAVLVGSPKPAAADCDPTSCNRTYSSKCGTITYGCKAQPNSGGNCTIPVEARRGSVAAGQAPVTAPNGAQRRVTFTTRAPPPRSVSGSAFGSR